MSRRAPLNTSLNNAAAAQEDEFYTQLVDVENELRHYSSSFRDKVVYCNCDDPSHSAFFHYFSLKFNVLGLKRLVTTCYKSRDRDIFSTGDAERAIYLQFDGYRDGERVPNIDDVGINYLQGDGDFRSTECVKLLNEADVVVTNPPFSLFSEYLNLLIENNKSFIIVGPYNAITHKDIFPHLMNNRVWLGNGFNGGNAFFSIKNKREFAKGVYDETTGLVKFRNVTWFTNIEHRKRNEELVLYKSYNETEYPRYDNFDAIEVGYTKLIPYDYSGNMGVPVTFFDKYNPNQFEIIGNAGSYAPDGYSLTGALYLNGKKMYKRIIIRNRLI